jgi:phosphoglycolate phosphatase-like HAD superfamily hydrolase
VSVRLVLWDIDHTLIELHRLHYTLYSAAFTELFGRAPNDVTDMSGRTDRESSTRLLQAHGIDPTEETLTRFWKELTRQFNARQAQLPHTGHATEGAQATLNAIAQRVDLYQSVLTGNLRTLAEGKLTVFRLNRYLDFDIGAYGEDSTQRCELVAVARARLLAKHAVAASPTETVLIGDTPLDIKAARDSGAHAIGVATGSSSAETLADAGADIVLPDLAQPEAVTKALASL